MPARQQSELLHHSKLIEVVPSFDQLPNLDSTDDVGTTSGPPASSRRPSAGCRHLLPGRTARTLLPVKRPSGLTWQIAEVCRRFGVDVEPGLKLESTRTALEVVVIDAVARPEPD
jgi:hypothetical protein